MNVTDPHEVADALDAVSDLAQSLVAEIGSTRVILEATLRQLDVMSEAKALIETVPADNAPRPIYHARLQITKNTKGYSYETSCSVDCDHPETTLAELRRLIEETDGVARAEIVRREALDGEVA